MPVCLRATDVFVNTGHHLGVYKHETVFSTYHQDSSVSLRTTQISDLLGPVSIRNNAARIVNNGNVKLFCVLLLDLP